MDYQGPIALKKIVKKEQRTLKTRKNQNRDLPIVQLDDGALCHADHDVFQAFKCDEVACSYALFESEARHT